MRCSAAWSSLSRSSNSDVLDLVLVLLTSWPRLRHCHITDHAHPGRGQLRSFARRTPLIPLPHRALSRRDFSASLRFVRLDHSRDYRLEYSGAAADQASPAWRVMVASDHRRARCSVFRAFFGVSPSGVIPAPAHKCGRSASGSQTRLLRVKLLLASLANCP